MEAIVRLLSYHDSPDVRAILAQERQEITMQVARRHNLPSQHRSSIPHLPASEDKPKKESIIALEVRAKSESRPSDHSSPAESKGPSLSKIVASSKAPNSAGRLPLPKRVKSLDTLRFLFPSAKPDLKGKVQWTDFVGNDERIRFPRRTPRRFRMDLSIWRRDPRPHCRVEQGSFSADGAREAG